MKSKIVDCKQCNKFFIKLDCVCKGTGKVPLTKVAMTEVRLEKDGSIKKSLVQRSILVNKYNMEYVKVENKFYKLNKSKEGQYFYELNKADRSESASTLISILHNLPLNE